jgi:thymidylate synthase
MRPDIHLERYFPEEQYLNLVALVLQCGEKTMDRTGVGTLSYFGGKELRFDLRQGFPLLTTKKVFTRGIIEELLWFLRGETNAKTLEDKGVNIWKQWGDPETRDLGPIYGKQWRDWTNDQTMSHEDFSAKYGLVVHRLLLEDQGPITVNSYTKLSKLDVTPTRVSFRLHLDQIKQAEEMIRNQPGSRRIIVNAWNATEVDSMALHPCHCLFQFKVSGCGKFLDLKLYQRSADIALGVPFNIASYALLLMMMARRTGLIPRHYIHSFGDAHIYLNHTEGLEAQLDRECRDFPLMAISCPPETELWEYKIEDFELIGYDPHPAIKFDIAV